jgi:hypothetical protein
MNTINRWHLLYYAYLSFEATRSEQNCEQGRRNGEWGGHRRARTRLRSTPPSACRNHHHLPSIFRLRRGSLKRHLWLFPKRNWKLQANPAPGIVDHPLFGCQLLCRNLTYRCNSLFETPCCTLFPFKALAFSK